MKIRAILDNLAIVVLFSSPLWADGAGWSLGGHLGYAEAGYSGVLDTRSTTTPFEDPGRLDLSGAVAGFQVGFAATRGTLLWGGELDRSIADLEDSVRRQLPFRRLTLPVLPWNDALRGIPTD